MTLKMKLIVLCAGLLALMICMGVLALRGMAQTNSEFTTTYNDRVLPLSQLKTVADMYAVNIVDTTHKANHQQLSPEQALALVKESRVKIDREWKAYASTEMTADEAKIVAETGRQMELANTAVSKLENILSSKDMAALDQFARTQLYSVIDPVSGNISRLVDLQLSEAKKNFEQSQNTFATTRQMTVGFILFALAFGAVFAGWVIVGMSSKINMLRDQLSRATERQDLTLRVPVNGADEIDSIATAYNLLASKMQKLVGDVASAIDVVSNEAESLATSSGQVSQATHMGSESTSAMAAAVEQMTVAISQVADSANAAREMGRHTLQSAQNGGTQIQKTVAEIRSIDHEVADAAEKVALLGQDADKISSIVGVIKDVADQTNLLALNAAIEAARAGEQGRGFAVVADEVRKLAERTASATVDIQQMVSRIDTTSKDAVLRITETANRAHGCAQIADDAGAMIVNINQDVMQEDEAVKVIAESLNEQRSSTQVIAQQVERVAQMTDENTAAVASMSHSAGLLGTLTKKLRGEVNLFQYQSS